jgi:hypothetical protein
VQSFGAVDEHRVGLTAVNQQDMGVELPVLLQGSLGIQDRVQPRGQTGHQFPPGHVSGAGTLVAQKLVNQGRSETDGNACTAVPTQPDVCPRRTSRSTLSWTENMIPSPMRPPRITCCIVVNVRWMAASSGPPRRSSGSYAATFRTCRRPMAPWRANRPPFAGPKTHSSVCSTIAGKILVLALDAVGGPEGATHPSTAAVGQVHRERVGKGTSKLHHVLRRVYATVQQDQARPLS